MSVREMKRKILFIEDRSWLIESIREAFKRYGGESLPVFVPSWESALEALNRERIDALFFSTMPSGQEALNWMNGGRDERSIPVIMMMPVPAGKNSIAAIQSGINDCVITEPGAVVQYPWVAECAIAKHALLTRLRQRLWHSHKEAAIGRLVSGVAHDINNALTAAIAYTELIGMKAADEGIRHDLNKVLESAERCKKIADNLLAFSRERNPVKSLESVNGMLDRAIDLRNYWLRAKTIEVMKEYDQVSTVFADAQQLQYAVLNIVMNAEQAIADSGRRPGRITCTTRYDRKKRMMLVRIADNGTGIPLDVMPRIFEPFFTTKPSGIGAGLGLSAARSIVAEHGGTLHAENREEGGAAFTIELPTGAAEENSS